ncbi:MAG: hydroxyacylglutathione hydrolase [Siculibacillus sp.]
MIDVRLFPARDDNYAVLLHDPTSGATATIDAPEVEAIADALDETGWRLTDILVTHHHYDHVEGVRALKAAWGARVVASAHDHALARVPEVDLAVADGDVVWLGTAPVRVLATPGHTLGHVCWLAEGAAFVGDTLFSLGCGRLFEGTPAQMWDSLLKLRALPPETTVWCGHEYTEANGRFALTIEPANPALTARIAEVRDLRLDGRPTVPTTIRAEIATNPFLRADVPAVKAALGMADRADWEVFAEIRARKDRF